jgi:hypothetical protein
MNFYSASATGYYVDGLFCFGSDKVLSYDSQAPCEGFSLYNQFRACSVASGSKGVEGD